VETGKTYLEARGLGLTMPLPDDSRVGGFMTNVTVSDCAIPMRRVIRRSSGHRRRLFTAMEIDNIALVAPGYYAGMGFGVPAGIGVAATGFAAAGPGGRRTTAPSR
jgi:hypothetical protein